MNDLGVLLAVCGLGIVCLAVPGIFGLMLMRRLSRIPGGALIGIFGAAARDEPDPNKDILPQRRSGQLTSSDLRNRARSLDFDAAVQRHRNTPQNQAASPPTQAPSLRGGAQSGLNRDLSDNGERRRSRRKREDERDEYIGGFLDID